MKKQFALFLLLLSIPCIGYTATGDVLFNCTFDGSGSTVNQVVTACGATDFSAPTFPHAVVATGGHDGGKYINWAYTSGEVDDLFTIPVNKPEITLVYWEKYDVAQSASSIWNCKSTRAYTNTSGGSAYIGATMSRWGAQWQQGVFYSATLTTTSAVSLVNSGSDYCRLVSGNTYNCGSGTYGAASVVSNPGLQNTAWHKVSIYYKMPSPVGSATGITKLWIDDTLIYTLSNIKGPPTGQTPWSSNVTHITVHPSDDFWTGVSGSRPSFHHGFDDITVYEGLVPPQGDSSVSPVHLDPAIIK